MGDTLRAKEDQRITLTRFESERRIKLKCNAGGPGHDMHDRR
jgi:hypothetical protein